MADTNAYCIEVCAEVRYWEDADVNGVDDTDGTLIPFRVGNLWKPLIRLSDGYIIGWPEGTTASIHYKVCDQGEYWLTDESQERIAKWKGDYVPDEFLCHGNQGYGDYIIFKVGADGKIAGWTLPDIVDKEWVLLPVDNDDLAQVMKAHPTRVTAAGVALLQQEIERLQATPLPADAALSQEPANAASVIEWARSKNRKPANTAFTAGAERQAAYWIEWAERERIPPADAALDDEAILDLVNDYGREKGRAESCTYRYEAKQYEQEAASIFTEIAARLRALSQPAAVPEAVAKDAEREVRIKLMVATELLKRAEPFTLCSHSDLNREIYVFLNHAILSAADTEVKNG